MSSVAAYGDGLNHHEGDALAPDDAADFTSRNKAMSERALFRLHQRIGLPVVTLRPPLCLRSGQNNPIIARRFSGTGCAPNRLDYSSGRRPPADAVHLC